MLGNSILGTIGVALTGMSTKEVFVCCYVTLLVGAYGAWRLRRWALVYIPLMNIAYLFAVGLISVQAMRLGIVPESGTPSAGPLHYLQLTLLALFVLTGLVTYILGYSEFRCAQDATAGSSKLVPSNRAGTFALSCLALSLVLAMILA